MVFENRHCSRAAPPISKLYLMRAAATDAPPLNTKIIASHGFFGNEVVKSKYEVVKRKYEVVKSKYEVVTISADLSTKPNKT